MDAITERKHKLRTGKVFPHQRKRGLVVKREFEGGIIKVEQSSWNGRPRERKLHATKGWRSHRA